MRDGKRRDIVRKEGGALAVPDEVRGGGRGGGKGALALGEGVRTMGGGRARGLGGALTSAGGGRAGGPGRRGARSRPRGGARISGRSWEDPIGGSVGTLVSQVFLSPAGGEEWRLFRSGLRCGASGEAGPNNQLRWEGKEDGENRGAAVGGWC
jgi:hypothetical protein